MLEFRPRALLVAIALAALLLVACGTSEGTSELGVAPDEAEPSASSSSTSTPPAPTATPTPLPGACATPPTTVLGTTGCSVVIGGGPPRFATPDPRNIPIATQYPVPDEATSLSLDEATALLREVVGVGAVLQAVERRDAEALTALISTVSVDCARPQFPIGLGRGSTLQDCIAAHGTGPDGKFEAVVLGGRHQSLNWMPALFGAALAAEPVELMFAARTTGPAPIYYLVFSAAPFELHDLSGTISEGEPRVAIAMEVRVDAEAPIGPLDFLLEDTSPLAWTQQQMSVHGDVESELIYPRSLDGFRRIYERLP